jgi:hypothetical protein
MANSGDIWSLLKSGLSAFANLLDAVEKGKSGQAWGASVTRYSADVADLAGKITKMVSAAPPSKILATTTSHSNIINLTGAWDDGVLGFNLTHFVASGAHFPDGTAL